MNSWRDFEGAEPPRNMAWKVQNKIHLPFLSKLTEQLVKSPLTENLTNHSLLNPHRRVCIFEVPQRPTSFHFMIMITWYSPSVINRLLQLSLLDLSAAFDTIDHTILLDQLSSQAVNLPILQILSKFINTHFLAAWLTSQLHGMSAKPRTRPGLPLASSGLRTNTNQTVRISW